ncbi:MAG: hypothetical protein NTW93_09010 [Phycisphaerae bacterium]|nr:hypothetical protein [Phycisphaerae bacterium]
MRTRQIYLFVYVILILAETAYSQNPASSQQLIPKTQWIKLYSEDNWTDRDPKLINIASAGYYAVGLSSFRNAETSYDYRLWIWKLDLQGNRIWSKKVVLPNTKEDEKHIWDKLLCLNNERLIIVRESQPKTGTWLIRFNEEGDISFAKELAMGRQSYVLRNIAKIKDGYLISGQELGDNNPDAWIMKIDSDGNILWQKTYDKGKAEDATSMVATEDGSFILAADCGEYNKFGGGPSNVWIIKCDSTGTILAETLFPGRHPTIARTANNIYAVSYNIADFPAVESYVVGLDSKLNKIWEPQLLYKGNGVGMYKIETDNRNNFIIAGSKFMEGLCLWKIDQNGKQLWSHLIGTKNPTTFVELLLTKDNEFLLAGSAGIIMPMPHDANNQQRKDMQWDISDILIANITEAASN